MGWNFRILVTETKMPDGEMERWFAIHEVYYDKNDVPNGATKLSTDVSGSSKKDVKWRLKEMRKCLSKPFLWGDDRFPEEYKKEKI